MQDFVRLPLRCALPLLVACASSSTADPEGTPAPSASEGGEAAGTSRTSGLPGLEIDVPEGWTEESPALAHAQSKKVDMGSKEANARNRARSNEPLVVLVKGGPAPAATIKAQVRPLGELAELSPEELAAVIVKQMEQTLPWFELDGEIEPATVGDRPAATFAFKLSLEMEGGEQVPFITRTWVVPRGDVAYTIGLTRPIADQAAEAEGEAAISSIRFE